MSGLRRGLVVVFVVALATAFVATSAWAAPPPPTIRGGLSGEQEVPGPGDPDGSGTYALTFTKLNASTTRLCWVLRVAAIDAPNAAHIHSGARHMSGSVVVPLPLALQDGAYRGCQDLAATTLQPIMANPRAYYVNVHNGTYPNGALRGQLHRVGRLG